MPTSREILWGGALLAGVLLYLYSRTKQGGAAADSATSSALDFIDVTASRITNFVQSRGYRNNNPGNLRFIDPAHAWQGQTANDGGYGVYDLPQNGVRAMGRQLLAYQARGLNTVRRIIGTWAPPDENKTPAYITDVCTQLDVDADEPFDVGDRLQDLCTAISRHENGYLDSSFDMAWCYL